jgi:branched-chain amino acid aminotransferase
VTETTVEPTAYFEDRFVPLGDARVSVVTHAFNYGTGVFEGIRAYWNEQREELNIFRLREHYERFHRNTRMVGIGVAHDVDQLVDITVQVVERSGYREDVYVRPLAYKSSKQIGVSMAGVDDDLTIFAVPFGNYIDIDRGLAAGVSSWTRSADNAVPARAKITGSYINCALTKSEALANGFDEAIVLNDRGCVSEGSAENIFMVRDGKLITPSRADGALEGITASTIVTIAANELGITTEERSIARTELYYADEIFFTGTGAQVAPVTTVDRKPIGNGSIGPISAAIQRLYFEVVRGRRAEYRHWLTPVRSVVPVPLAL